MPLGSWYSQLPAFGWFDREDRPGSNALGVPDWQQGIALPSRRTLGQWYNVTPPGASIPYPFQQTDVGPAKWTGRGVDISAAAAHQMGMTPTTFPTDANFKIEPRDEPRGLGSPAGLPVQAGDLPDNSVGDAYASGPSPARKSMPASLLDMFTPTSNVTGQPVGFNDAIAQNRNSLIGLGMGLLQPRSLAVGAPTSSAWTNALGGYQAGAQADAANAYRQAQLAHQKNQEALQREEFAFRKTQAGVTEFQRAARDLGLTPGSPEYADAAKKFYEPKVEGDWKTGSIKDPNTETEHPYAWNQRTNEYRWGPNGPPASLAAGARSNPFVTATNPLAPGGATAGGGGISTGQPSGGGVSYGQAGMGGQGFGTGGVAPAYPGGPSPAAPTGTTPGSGAPQLPGWVQNLPPSVRKEAEKEAVKGQIKMQTTQAAQEPAAKASAQNVLQALDTAETLATTSKWPTTGIMGGALKNIYQPGRDLDATLNTIKAGVSLDKLQQMRANSPSGASGLGAVTEGEHRLLQATIAALDQSQSQGQFLQNLQHVRNTYSWILNRTNPNEPPPAAPPQPRAPTAPGGRTGGAGLPAAVQWGRDAQGNPVPLR